MDIPLQVIVPGITTTGVHIGVTGRATTIITATPGITINTKTSRIESTGLLGVRSTGRQMVLVDQDRKTESDPDLQGGDKVQISSKNREFYEFLALYLKLNFLYKNIKLCLLCIKAWLCYWYLACKTRRFAVFCYFCLVDVLSAIKIVTGSVIGKVV